eukprot:13152512-Alexandrium_andersonii.AAC.1
MGGSSASTVGWFSWPKSGAYGRAPHSGQPGRPRLKAFMTHVPGRSHATTRQQYDLRPSRRPRTAR